MANTRGKRGKPAQVDTPDNTIEKEINTLKRHGKTIHIAGDDQQEPEDIDFEQRDSLRDVIDRLIGEPEAEGSVRVSRKRDMSRSAGVFLFDMSPAEWRDRGELTFLQNRYGAGIYEIRIYGNGETGYGLVRRLVLEVGEPVDPIPVSTANVNTPSNLHPAPGLGSGAGAQVDVVGAIREMGAQQSAFIQRMFELMMPMILAQRGVPQQQTPLVELVAAMKNMQDMTRPQAALSAPVDPFAMMEKVTALAEKFAENSGGGGGSEMTELLKLGRVFIPLIRDGMNSAPAQPQRSQLPAPDNIQPMDAPDDTENDEMFIKMMITSELKKLVDAARNNDDPAQHAERLLGIIPGVILDDWCGRDDWLKVVAAYNPEVTAFADWFNRLMENLTTDDVPGNDGGNLVTNPGDTGAKSG